MSSRDETYSLLSWRKEHEEIEGHVASAERAVASGSVESASSAMDKLAEALEDHLSVEERAYLPMVEQLSPRGADFSASVRLAHAGLRESLEQLRELVELAQWPEAQRSFAVFAERFRGHEAQEHAFEDIREEVGEGEMPLASYLVMHPSARLSDGERELLLRWAGGP
jgi:hypothetical protein